MAMMMMMMAVYDHDHLGLGCDGSQEAKEDQSEQNVFHGACRMRLLDLEPHDQHRAARALQSPQIDQSPFSSER